MNTFPEQTQIEEQSVIPGEPGRAGQFAKGTLITVSARILTLILGIATYVILARILGPEGKGIYTLAALLPTLIVTFISLGIDSANAYYVAKGDYSRQEILGANIVFALVIGAIGIMIGLMVALFFSQSIFPGVAQDYLLLALVLIPMSLIFSYLQYILLGAQRFKEYNLIAILRALLFLIFIVIGLWALKTGIAGALLAGVFALFLANIVLFLWVRRISGGISVKLHHDYIKKALVYGIQIHLFVIIVFLNYRVDMFLINSFLNPAAVGFYTIAVGLVEKIWLIPHAMSTVLFPKVVAETDEQRRKEFTPLVARTVLWISALGALALFFLGRWIVEIFFSAEFLPAVRPLQILLPGIVAMSVWAGLANDISGRGRPMLNTYIGGMSLVVNVLLNILWIPMYGINGAALASTVSYGVTLVVQLFVYCRVSGNSWTNVLLPQPGDWVLYWRTGLTMVQWMKVRAKALL